MSSRLCNALQSLSNWLNVLPLVSVTDRSHGDISVFLFGDVLIFSTTCLVKHCTGFISKSWSWKAPGCWFGNCVRTGTKDEFSEQECRACEWDTLICTYCRSATPARSAGLRSFLNTSVASAGKNPHNTHPQRSLRRTQHDSSLCLVLMPSCRDNRY